MTVIAIPRVLQDRLTPEGAQALVDIINQADDRTKENVVELAEQRFEKRLAQVESRIILWMFTFWAGQIGVITGILFAFFKK